MVTRVLMSLGLVLMLAVTGSGGAQAQMCVKVARSLTNFTIRGDAWTWWQGAANRYERSSRPTVGSVLVFKRTGKMPRGHVSVVSQVINSRVVRVDHSWIDGDGLVRGMRVVDISPRNDWTNVRVWHPPTDSLGMRTYAAFGFIHPAPAARGGIAVATLDDDLVDAVANPKAARAEDTGERLVLTKKSPRTAALPEIVLPRRKPGSAAPRLIEAEAPADTIQQAKAVIPPKKPMAKILMADKAASKRKPDAQVADLPSGH
ncbi:MAG TPA: CHAP domain-containing protein [Azospirillaceae bacterium]|nr:CHAP domain-containing protein [Azospirillaceae bacterium]